MRNELPQGRKPGLESVDPDRRKALKTLGQFAVYVSPAMTVLLPGKADAHHKPWHTDNCKNFPGHEYCSPL
jgi:hypothetical protein